MVLALKTFAIITTIQSPTKSVKLFQSALAATSIPLIVVGDRKGPPDYPDWAYFLGIDSQFKLPFTLARLLPEKHYSRKNLGYLYCFSKGAERLYETDDDNAPLPNWAPKASVADEARILFGGRWLNVYRHYTSINIWPRGLALEFINEVGALGEISSVFSPVRQGLANGSPDVDAIWRLTMDSNVIFEPQGTFSLSKNVWCPFNSQNTWWFKEAFPLMYLPSYVSFRMTDIWRSFVAQRCLWAMGTSLAFHEADVFQERNAHCLSKDFSDEVQGYLYNDKIAVVLEKLELPGGSGQIMPNLLQCYDALVGMGVVPEKELPLVAAWVDDCKRFLI